MSGVGNILNTSQRNIPLTGPFVAGAAVNGLSVNGAGKIVLGQDVGAVGNPAILLNNREIPMGGFLLELTNAGNRKFVVDPGTDTFILGDVDAQTHGSFFEIDNLGDIVINNALQSFLTILPPASGGLITLQMNGGTPNGMGFLLDGTNGSIAMGDNFGGGNLTQAILDDANQFFEVVQNFGANQFLLVDIANDVFTMGDLAGTGSNTLLYLDGTNTFAVQSGGNQLIDIGGSPNIWQFGAIAWGNGTRLRVNDQVAVQQVQVLATNGLQVPGGAFLVHTAAGLTNGAGANVGTLNNSPVAGDPTSWIAIDDGGVTRHIPAW